MVCGFVRGIGQESMATNTNPLYNRERFDEAHNVIVDAWTKPGPFRYEGKHYHYRVVNPWVMPLQKPHPPIWIPGVASPESVIWAAQHQYPYVALARPCNCCPTSTSYTRTPPKPTAGRPVPRTGATPCGWPWPTPMRRHTKRARTSTGS